MTRELVGSAARNNALWCDAVCSAHGVPGEFLESVWLNRHGTPRYYPDVVTLRSDTEAPLQTIAALVASFRDGGWAVKDSFRCLDLEPLGFSVLFEAEWIGMRSPVADARYDDAGLEWRAVAGGAGLIDWEREWAGANAGPADPRVIPDRLQPHADLRFLLALDDGVPVCGGALNRGAGVVGLSNVFASGVEPDMAWNGLVREAVKSFPDLPLVGYERGQDLVAARRAGFESMGEMRVWLRS